MITMFSIIKDNKRFTFKAKRPAYGKPFNYYCNNSTVTEEQYKRNEQAFRATRPILCR